MSQPTAEQQPSDADLAAGQAVAALVAAQATQRAVITRQAVALATQSAQQFTDWYDSDAITAWASSLAGRIETLQRSLARSTDAYLSRVLTQMLGTRVSPVGRVDVTSLRDGVTHPGAYGRAADVFRWQQSRLDAFGRDLAAAEDTGSLSPPDLVAPIDAALERVRAVADMDMQLADRAQSQAVLTQHADRHDISGYRRVIHPERSRGGTCGLCIAASDRIYHVHDLRAVHDRCECTTLPIAGGVDPGSGLNNLDLRDLYKHAGGTTGAAGLKGTRYQIDEHGELGPVLNPAGAKVRTSRQAAADEARRRAAKTPQQRAAALSRARGSIEQALPKARDLAAADPQKWGRYLTQIEARLRDLDSQLAAS